MSSLLNSSRLILIYIIKSCIINRKIIHDTSFQKIKACTYRIILNYVIRNEKAKSQNRSVKILLTYILNDSNHNHEKDSFNFFSYVRHVLFQKYKIIARYTILSNHFSDIRRKKFSQMIFPTYARIKWRKIFQIIFPTYVR